MASISGNDLPFTGSIRILTPLQHSLPLKRCQPLHLIRSLSLRKDLQGFAAKPLRKLRKIMDSDR